jgi:RNA polymerase sigma-70 factor, ECF subfamily
MTERSMPAENARQLVQKLFLEHIDALKGFVSALVPATELVDDIIQETFVAVSARADHYDPQTRFSDWLFVVARDKIREAGGRAAAEARPFSDAVLDVLAATHGEVVASATKIRLVDECVAALAPQARRIITLRYRNAMKPREVARSIGWTAGSVRVALSRARAAIRECVERKLTTAEG